MTVTKLHDLDEVEREARKELSEDRMKEAKKQIKAKLQAIAKSEQVTENLRRELAALKDELSAGL